MVRSTEAMMRPRGGVREGGVCTLVLFMIPLGMFLHLTFTEVGTRLLTKRERGGQEEKKNKKTKELTNEKAAARCE